MCAVWHKLRQYKVQNKYEGMRRTIQWGGDEGAVEWREDKVVVQCCINP